MNERLLGAGGARLSVRRLGERNGRPSLYWRPTSLVILAAADREPPLDPSHLRVVAGRVRGPRGDGAWLEAIV